MLKDNGHAWGGVWYEDTTALVGGNGNVLFATEQFRGLLSPEVGT